MVERDWYEGDGAWLWDDGRALIAGLLERAAEAGFAPALVELGDLRREGKLLDEDLPEAARMYRRGAAAGDPDAVGRLGAMIFEGRGVPLDRNEGLRLLKRAAKAGSANARFYLGRKLMLGRDVPPDQAEAARLLESAVKGGDDEAIGTVGLLLASQFGFKGWPPWFLPMVGRSAEAGLAYANGILGMFNEFGFGTPVDLVAARRYYERGARASEISSAISLARFLYSGMGGPVDRDGAREWLVRLMGEDEARQGLRWLSDRSRDFPWSSRVFQFE